MLRRRALALVFGALVAIAAATAASAQGRHLVGSTLVPVRHAFAVSSGSHARTGTPSGASEDQQGDDNDDQGEDQDSQGEDQDSSLGDPAGSDHPSMDPPTSPSESGDQGDQNEQGDQNDQGDTTGSNDQGDQNDQGDGPHGGGSDGGDQGSHDGNSQG